MKNNIYVKQFFCDGFGSIVFMKPYHYIMKHIKVKWFEKLLIFLLVFFYIALMILLMILIFNFTYPF